MLLSRYFYREVLGTSAALLTLLILIFLSHWFIRYLGQASMGLLPSDFILQLLLLRLLMVLSILLPLGFFLAILLALGRLYTDNEMVAMSACGMGTPFVLKKFTQLGMLFALLVGLLSFVLAPWAERQEDQLMLEAKKTADIAGIAAGHFKEFAQGQGVFYVETLADDKHTMQNVFAAFDQDGETLLLTAESARQTLQTEHQLRYMSLYNGQRYQGTPGTAALRAITFAEHHIRLDPPADIYHQADLGSAPTAQLWQPGDAANMAELQRRLSAPLGILLLTPLAVLLSYTTPRQGRYGKVVLAILIYFSYGNLLQVAHNWMSEAQSPLWLGMWWAHGLLLAAIGLLYWRRRRQRLL